MDSVRSDWTWKNTYFLALMTVGYIIGEIAHFLINTTNRAVARDVHFGDKSCYLNSSHYTGHDDSDGDGSGNVQDKTKECADQQNSTQCLALAPQCEWNYSGVGVQYQVLSGTVFALTFTFTALVVGFTADKISKSSFGRHRLMAIGVLVFSTSCLLTGFSSAYWHLVILRVGIAAGEAVCRPISGGLIADVFFSKCPRFGQRSLLMGSLFRLRPGLRHWHQPHISRRSGLWLEGFLRDTSHSRIPHCRPPFYQREGAVQRRPKPLTTSLRRNKRDQQFRTVESGQEVTVVIRSHHSFITFI